jgi:hypothetical protein
MGRFPYKASTYALLYCRQRPHLYYGGQVINTFCPPPPQFLLHMRAALLANYKGTQSVHCIGERTRNVVYNVRSL